MLFSDLASSNDVDDKVYDRDEVYQPAEQAVLANSLGIFPVRVAGQKIRDDAQPDVVEAA